MKDGMVAESGRSDIIVLVWESALFRNQLILRLPKRVPVGLRFRFSGMALAHKCGWSGRPVVVCSCAHASSSAWSMQSKMQIRWCNNAPSEGGCVSPTSHGWLQVAWGHFCEIYFGFVIGAMFCYHVVPSQKNKLQTFFLVYGVGLYAKHSEWMWSACWAWMLPTGRNNPNKRRILVQMRWVCAKRRFCLVIVLANIIRMWNGMGMTCATFRTLMCSKFLFEKG